MCARREAEEELGITLWIGRLLVEDWCPPCRTADPGDHVFDGGVLTDDQIATLRPADQEVKSWR